MFLLKIKFCQKLFYDKDLNSINSEIKLIVIIWLSKKFTETGQMRSKEQEPKIKIEVKIELEIL